MPTLFPLTYTVDLAAQGPAARLLASGHPPLTGGAPSAFEGRDDWWSPEDLLLASLELCLKTTFDAVAHRRGLKVLAYRSQAQGTLEKTREGLLFTRFVVRPVITVEPSHVELAHAVLETTRRACIVSRALAVPVEVEAEIVPTAADTGVPLMA